MSWRSAAVSTWGRARTCTREWSWSAARLHREPGARVGGEIQEVGFGEIDMSRWRLPRGAGRQWWPGRTLGSAFSLVSTLVRVGMLCLLAALVLLFGRDYVSSRRQPGRRRAAQGRRDRTARAAAVPAAAHRHDPPLRHHHRRHSAAHPHSLCHSVADGAGARRFHGSRVIRGPRADGSLGMDRATGHTPRRSRGFS